MPSYQVFWAVTIESDQSIGPEEVAEAALDMILEGEHWHFTVINETTGDQQCVDIEPDLDEIGIDEL